jgi:hypothetical protein
VADDWSAIDRSHGYFRVIVELTPTEEGGRLRPVVSGYKPHWVIGAMYEGKPMMTDGQLVLEDVEELVPGATATGRIHPAFPEYWLHVQPEQTIYGHEGSRRIARATVIEVVRPTDA